MLQSITSPEQQKVLDYIRRYRSLHGESPSLSVIASALQYSNRSAVQHHVSALRKKGLLEFANSDVSLVEIPLVGSVSCGPGILAVENIEAYIPVDSSVMKRKSSKYFMLEATGDSMELSNISDGDFLLVRQESVAKNGDKIVALIGEDATCKIFESKAGKPIRLVPNSNNPIHKPRIMLEDFSILGVVEKTFKKAGGGWQAV